jgi:hypothetical protein
MGNESLEYMCSTTWQEGLGNMGWTMLQWTEPLVTEILCLFRPLDPFLSAIMYRKITPESVSPIQKLPGICVPRQIH